MFSLNQVIDEESFTAAEIITIQVAEITALKLIIISISSNLELKEVYNAEVLSLKIW